MLSRHSLKKKYLIPAVMQLLTIGYNVNNVVLYFCSADNFAAHMGFTNDRLTSLDAAWELPVLIAVSVCDSLLLISNQIVFPKRLEKMFCHTEDANQHSTLPAKILRNSSSFMTGVFKAIIMSSSLLALLNSLVGLEAGLAMTFLLLPGNLLAELSMFFEPYLEKLPFLKSPTLIRWFARYCGLAYGVSNGALYFNSIDLAPKDIGWLNERVIDERSPVGISVLSLYTLASLQFTYATYHSFTRRINFVLQEKSEESRSLEKSEDSQPLLSPQDQRPIRFRERCSTSTVTASMWKTIVTSLSLIALTHVYGVPEIGYPIAAVLLIGNFLSQLTLYARDDEEVKKSKSRGSSWCSFFSSCCVRGSRAVLPASPNLAGIR